MKTIVLTSQNPVKAQAVRNGFERMFPDEEFRLLTVRVSSGVRDQPGSNKEAFQGAFNRACQAATAVPQANYWVGVEGGIEDEDGEMAAFAWIVIKSADRIGKGRTGTFYLPQKVADLVRQGKELGEADDIVFGKSNSKQQNGAIGLLTGDVVDRAGLYEQAVILALVPFKNPDLYK